jgi:uncharacterized protein
MYVSPMAIVRMLSVLLAAFLLWAVFGPAAAQEGDALRFFQQNPSSARLLFRAPPRTQSPLRPRRDLDEGQARRRPSARSDVDTALAPAPTDPPVAPSIFVHVVGDSLSDSLANGLREHLAPERPDIAVLRKGKASSGLVREDFHNWPVVLRDMLAGSEKVDLVVMMLGSNDRQQLKDESGAHDFKSERWREIYAKRVDDVIAVVRDKRIPLIWVGMPPLESPRLSADMLYLNELYKERATRAGIPYVDVWDAFVSDQNQYAAAGPDVSGEIVRLRTSDGIHFTRAGARKLGFFSAAEILRNIGRDALAAPAVASLPKDLSEQIRRDTPGLTPQALQGALSLPDEPPALPVIRERPLQGPVIELTATPSSPGAQLARARFVAPSSEMSIMVEQVLAYGRLPPPKPGRADDFRWPGDRGVN